MLAGLQGWTGVSGLAEAGWKQPSGESAIRNVGLGITQT